MSRNGNNGRRNKRARTALPSSRQAKREKIGADEKQPPARDPTRITYTTRDGKQKTVRLQMAIQRAFVRWFQSAQPRFVLPVDIVRVGRHALTMDLGCFAGYIYVMLGERGIEVGAEWKSEPFDLLWENFVYMKKGADGYYCEQCLPETKYAKSYPSRESLWIEHVFEPFVDWVNHKLARAKFLNFYATDEWGITDARLSETEHPGSLVFLGDVSQIASVTPDGTVQVRDTPLPDSCRKLLLKPVR